jgi:hypothetical protein
VAYSIGCSVLHTIFSVSFRIKKETTDLVRGYLVRDPPQEYMAFMLAPKDLFDFLSKDVCSILN